MKSMKRAFGRASLIALVSLACLTLASCGNVFSELAGATLVTVAYDQNGAGSGSVPAEMRVIAGRSITLPGNPGGLAKSGCDFVGWGLASEYRDPDTYRIYEAGDTLAVDAALTLYAVFLENFSAFPYVDGSGAITGIDINNYGRYSSGDPSHLEVKILSSSGGRNAVIVINSMSNTSGGYYPSDIIIMTGGSGYSASDAITIAR